MCGFYTSLPPPKERGYVFTRFCCPSVCLSVCLSARLLKKLWTDLSRADLGGEPDDYLDPVFFKGSYDRLYNISIPTDSHSKNKRWRSTAQVWTLWMLSKVSRFFCASTWFKPASFDAKHSVISAAALLDYLIANALDSFWVYHNSNRYADKNSQLE